MTIREVPNETRDELAARAARVGQSLEQYVRALLIELARRPSLVELWDRVDQRVRATGSRLAAEKTLELHDHDRQWRSSSPSVPVAG
ncbi:hypothetical protein SAMN05660690_2485 [Geodermatophilus telluris]|uniref:Antitoxin FitA-like ribbon-helix-helix domain-containing protein n=1 Tax=Geodermatophilus telluris TaxID=1190417 RepID=A0A1G6PCL7_9ACTN|nr:hypothetical protein SAMN05660690_2485 [Geodermatophilus telluris]